MRNNIKRFAVAVLAACGLVVSAALAAPSYQARLTVQGYVGESELTDFPVLVRLSPQTVVEENPFLGIGERALILLR